MCNMFQDNNLVVKFIESCENLRQGTQGILTKTTNGSVTGFAAIPFVIFFQATGQLYSKFLHDLWKIKKNISMGECDFQMDYLSGQKLFRHMNVNRS